ncbi:MAG: YbjN domain-containing protein [Coleofasciculus sp. D1-CHI-01]|uniref:YbjN domain-containing protein n=1 Tax=Coleofasciculus sp. D1-CHI-01 TaxID=3068482 RepID=UPI0032F59E81
MVTKTENHQTDIQLILYDSLNSSLTVRAVNLTLTKKENEIIECRLIFLVNLSLYQRIETNALFNLNPFVRISPTGGDFQPSPDIQIEASLKPDLLPHLLKHATNASEAAAYLLNQSQQQKSGESETVKTESSNNDNSPNPLLATENWLALSVKQFQKSGEVGYRTLWSHFSLLGLSVASSSKEEISESITNLFQDLTGFGLDTATKEITTKSIGAVTNFLRNLAENIPESSNQNTTPPPPKEPPKAKPQDTPSTQSLFQSIVNFFKEDNWSFAQIKGQSALHLAFEGKNGKCDCYAQAREQQKQFVFYSVCPAKVPKPKRRAVGEFLSRANYGMIIGNFELNFDDGEVRYKTSIDVKNNDISSEIIKQLVYTNVMMMDQYLPGITSVISGKMSPAEAIAQIEAKTD